MDRAQWKILLSAWVLSADPCHFILLPDFRKHLLRGQRGGCPFPGSVINHPMGGPEESPTPAAALCRCCSCAHYTE